MPDQEERMYDAGEIASTEVAAQPDEEVAVPSVDPLELEAKYLLGAAFPARKEDLIVEARRNDAPRRVLAFLEGLEDREYADVPTLLAKVERREQV